MVGKIYHVGLTVSDLDKSVTFYRDILGLEFQGEIQICSGRLFQNFAFTPMTSMRFTIV